jgi:hypothetical protein
MESPANHCRVGGNANHSKAALALKETVPPWQAKRLLVPTARHEVILFDDVTTKSGSVMQAVRARGATVKNIITS